MASAINIYCDESCHLENDGQGVMVLGGIWCPLDKRREIAVRLREIKRRHGFTSNFEVKWTKVSHSAVAFYLDYVDYFFDDDDLHFRALVIPDKALLRHEDFGQDHDTWYYKMYFDMLKVIFDPTSKHQVYIDQKDTRGAAKVRKLHDVLCNNMYDFSREIIQQVQLVQSKESEQIQLADLLTGAISYVNRGLTGNAGKVALAERIKKRSGYSLTQTTLLREQKVNLLRWQAQLAQDA